MAASTKTVKPGHIPWWKKGDIAAFFALLTNNLTNLLTVIALMTFVVGLPKDIVFGRVVPAFGLGVFLASTAYVIYAKQLAKKTGRGDICALPSGPAAPAVFTITFLVILPVYQQTGNANLAIGIALVWGFCENLILFVGAFIGDWLRRVVPRTVLLSCLAGLGLLLLAMNPMLQSFAAPVVAFVVLTLVFINWFGRKPMFMKIPTGLLLLIVGTALGWIFGLMDPQAIRDAIAQAGFTPPQVYIQDIWGYAGVAGPYLVSAVPLALANFVFDVENIEAAHVAGDPYPSRRVILADSGAGFVANFFGSPFPVTVYVGHTAYKSMGAGVGYTLLNGVAMLVICMFGLGNLLLSIIPVAAIAPILIFIGIVTANQVVRETPKLEIPVIFVALFPWIANWGLGLANNALKAAGTNANSVGAEALNAAGTNWTGLITLGNGAPIVSMIWGCIAIFAIRNQPLYGVGAGAVGAFLSFFGIIHVSAPVIGGQGWMIWSGYLLICALFIIKWIENGFSQDTEADWLQTPAESVGKSAPVVVADTANVAANTVAAPPEANTK